MDVTTFHRRRQWRDRRKPDSDFVADLKIGAHCALAMLFLGLLLLILFLGDPFINLFFGD